MFDHSLIHLVQLSFSLSVHAAVICLITFCNYYFFIVDFFFFFFTTLGLDLDLDYVISAALSPTFYRLMKQLITD